MPAKSLVQCPGAPTVVPFLAFGPFCFISLAFNQEIVDRIEQAPCIVPIPCSPQASRLFPAVDEQSFNFGCLQARLIRLGKEEIFLKQMLYGWAMGHF